MTCVFDENLPPKLAKALNTLEGKRGIEVFHLRDRFPANTKDIEWINSLSEIDNCFIITKDRNIRRNPHELLAWKESNLKIVFLKKAWDNQSFWNQSWKFIKRWEDIKNKIERVDSFLLPVSGKIEEIDTNR